MTWSLRRKLNVAHGAGRRWAAGGEQRVYQGAERADGVHAGLAGAAQNKDLDGPKLAQAHVQVEIFVERGDGRVQKTLQLIEAQAGNRQIPYRGDKNLSVPIYGTRVSKSIFPHTWINNSSPGPST